FGCPSAGELIGTADADSVTREEMERLQIDSHCRAEGEAVPTHYEVQSRRRDGSVFPVERVVGSITYDGQPACLVVSLDLTERKRLKLFEAILPVCSVCGKVRDDTGKGRDRGHWLSLQEYVGEHTDTSLSHGFCPDCYRDYRRQAGLPETPSPRRH
ncbi:MAG: PAS domain S-box protein, partial [Acidobacteria bacterium]|nr:PAS domain S-box protein [Acidobacteriota bacterium]